MTVTAAEHREHKNRTNNQRLKMMIVFISNNLWILKYCKTTVRYTDMRR